VQVILIVTDWSGGDELACKRDDCTLSRNGCVTLGGVVYLHLGRMYLGPHAGRSLSTTGYVYIPKSFDV